MVCLLSVFTSSFTPVNAATGINHQINFQGKLVNTNGTNVTDGTYSIVYSIYTVASAGTNIWTETQSVTVTNGIFQVALGSVTALPGSIDFNTDNIYLGVKVGADAEMTPRIQFTSVPQAFNSEKLGGLDKTGFLQNTTSVQTGTNFFIQSTGTANVTGTIRQNTSQTADLLQFQNSSNNKLLGVDVSGKLQFADGAGGAYDTNLYRSAAGTLKTDTDLLVNGIVSSNGGVNVNTAHSLVLQNAAADTNVTITNTGATGVSALRILAANGLGLNTATMTGNGLNLNASTTATGQSSIYFGTDTNLYRSAADTLKTDDSLTVAGTISSPGAGASSEHFGNSSTAAGASATALGRSTAASGTNSIAIGTSASTGSASGAIVIGQLGQVGNSGATDAIAIGRSAAVADVNSIAIGGSALSQYNASIALGANATASGANQFVVGGNSAAIQNVYIGNGVTNAGPASFTLQGTGGSGANIAGANVTLAGGQGTGTGNGGNINFQVAKPGASSSSANILATVASLSGINGSALFKNSADSTTAFQVQNAAATPLLTVNSTSSYIDFGNSGRVDASGSNFILKSIGAASQISQQAARFTLQDTANGSVAVLDIQSGGQATFKSSVNSTSAFQVQTSAGIPLLSVDSSNQQLAVGPNAVVANGVLTVGTNTTAASGGIYFGTDTNLYRDGANSLRTGSNFRALSYYQVGASTSSTAINLSVTGDTVCRLCINSDGNLNWGGGSAAVDTSLYRSSAGVLNVGINGSLKVFNTAGDTLVLQTDTNSAYLNSTTTASGDLTLASRVSGDSAARFSIKANGTTEWGLGSGAQDISLAHDYTNVLRFTGSGTNGAGSRLYFGDGNNTTNQNAWIGEYGATDSDILQLHGKNGITLTVGGAATAEVATIGSTGRATFVNSTDSTTAFTIQNAATTPVLTVNTTNQTVGISSGGAAADAKLYVSSSSLSVLRANASGSNNVLELQGSGANVVTVGSTGNTVFSDGGTNTYLTLASGGAGTNYTINNGISAENNEAQNPGFELTSQSMVNGAAGWCCLSGTIITDSTIAHTGNSYLNMTANSSIRSVGQQKTFTVVPGETLYAEVWARTSAGANGTGGFYWSFDDKDHANTVYDASDWANPGTTWTRKTLISTVPAGKYFARFSTTIRADATTGSWYFDDAFIMHNQQSAPTLYKNNIDSTTAFQIQNAAGTSVFSASTSGVSVNVRNQIDLSGTYALVQSNVAGNDLQLRTATGAGALSFQTNGGTEQARIGSTGATVFKNSTNATTAFQIQNTAAAPILNVDTTISDVTLNQGSLYVKGLARTNSFTGTTSTAGGTLPTATTYYYKLAPNGPGGEGAYFTNTNSPLTTGAGAANSNTVSWSAVPNATGYYLYRSTDNATWTAILLGAVTTYTDTSNAAWVTSRTPNAYSTNGNISINTGSCLNLDGLSSPNSLANACYSIGNNLQLSNLAVNGRVQIHGDNLQFQDNSYHSSLDLSTTGQALFQNRTDSTTAFRVQNAAGTNLLVANSTAGQLAIGPAAAAANGVLTIGTNTTSAAGGQYFGTDTNLYRSAASTLKTDTSFTIGSGQFTNSASTLNTAQSLGNYATGGAIGTAAATVDVATSFAVAQTTAGQILSLPNPTSATAGRVTYVLNTGSVSFTMHSVTIPNGYGQIYIWNGTTWILGASGGGSAITLQAAYDGGNTLNTSNARDISVTLGDTATDANFKINVATSSTGAFKVQNNGTDVLSLGSAGQLQLSVQGSTGGVLLGGDTNLYRSAADTLKTDDNLIVAGGQLQVASGFLKVISAASGNSALQATVSGDAQNRYEVSGGGTISWGSGSATADTNLYRSAADTLKTDDSLVVQGNGVSNALMAVTTTYSTGTIAQTTTAITGTGTTFTAAMSGGTITYSDGTTAIVTYISATSLTSSVSKTVTAGATYSITYGGFTVGATGSVTSRNTANSTTAFQVQNAGGSNVLNIETTSTAGKLTVGNSSQAGLTWTFRNSAVDNQWTSVIYGNGLFVAVSLDGTGNRVMTSPDGITWTTRTSAANNNWTSVTYGNGQFVAVANSGTGNRVMTSPDGITWTIRTSAADNSWRTVTYGNGLFVAVANTGTGNRVMTSPDGITWTIRTSAADNNWNSVIYGNGQFVAVANTGTGNRVMTSPDGITWTIRTSAADNSWQSVTYGNGLFVAVAGSGTGNRTMTSPDGITWTIRTSAADNFWYSVAYGNGQFVAVSIDGYGNRVMSSGGTSLTLDGSTIGRVGASDGIIIKNDNNLTNAFSVQTPVGLSVLKVDTFTGNIQVQGQKNAGITWTNRTSAADSIWTSITYGNGLFVAVGQTGTGTRVMTSPDGITWTLRTSAADIQWNSVTYGNGLFVAVSDSGTGNRVMTSPDGITWTSRTSAADNGWYSVTYGNGLFVAVAYTGTGNRVMTSPDGITWTLRTSAADNNWYSVTYGNNMFVAVAGSGTGNRVMTSPDGITWTIRTSAADNYWNSVTYGNGLFVAVALTGTGNRVMTSPDGITWTIRTSAADLSWRSITYANGLFVAVSSDGTGNRVMTSPDGITWTIRTSAADNQWYGVTSGNGLFVAVALSGTGNRIMTSGGTLLNISGATLGAAGIGTGITISNESNSTTAFQIQNSSGTSLLTADTSNLVVSVNGTLQVAGSDACGNTGCTTRKDEARAWTNSNLFPAFGTTSTYAFEQEDYDTNAMHDTVTNNSRITFPRAGTYHVMSYEGIGLGSCAAGTITFSLVKNGSTTLTSSVFSSSNNGITYYTGTFSAGDYLEVKITNSSGSACSIIYNSGQQYNNYIVVTNQLNAGSGGVANSAFSVGATNFSTGTISQSGTTVTGTGTNWFYDFTGGTIYYSDGTTALVTYVSSTSLTSSVSKTVSAGSTYRIVYGGTYIQQSGALSVQPSIASTSAFEVKSSPGSSIFSVDTSNRVVKVGLGSTASTSAVCSSLGNATSPTAGTSYELRDCSGAPAADYAENYPVAAGIDYGDIVSTGTNLIETYDETDGVTDWNKPKGKITQLVKTNSPNQANTIGIVSNNYNNFTSAGYNIKEEDNPKPVALNGRVPVKISSSSAAISPGDYLTTSTEAGKAIKATGPGFVIGKALAAWDPSSGEPTVIVFVEPGYYGGPSQTDLVQNGGNAILTGLTVSGTADFANINVSGATTLTSLNVTGSVAIQGTLTVTSIVVGDITVSGHIITAGDAPTTNVETTAGTGAICTISGNDTSGKLILVTGTGTNISDGMQCTITFDTPFAAAPNAVISARNKDSAQVGVWVDSDANTMTINFANAPTPSTTYNFSYINTQ